MHRKGGRVVIGMTALIGMRDDRLRTFLQKTLTELPGKRREVVHRFLVDDAQTERPKMVRAAFRQSGRQLSAARRLIIRQCRKAISGGVMPIARRAIGDMHEQRVVKSPELRAEADRLVIGMRGHDNDTIPDSLSRREPRQDFFAGAHPSAAAPSRAGPGAKPAPARQ